MSFLDNLAFEAGVVARSVGDYFSGGALRLGVTGLSRSGKTVFVTSLVNNLLAQARLPVLAASAEGRIAKAHLDPQPDDAVPRFPYEEHLAALDGPDRHWPQSTRRISQLRLRIEFERAAGWRQGPARLDLDIVDYPGEWLLDLTLLDKSYARWSNETIAASRAPARAALAGRWLGHLDGLDPQAPFDEDSRARRRALFTEYLQAARADVYALSTLPPGRFLMPGDLEGSPALTFAPLAVEENVEPATGSLAAMMQRRYESYKTHVVKPFFRDHFSRLDRQIVLVDTLERAQFRPGGAARSRKRADRGDARLPRRPRLDLRLDLSPARRSHPVCRDESRPSASRESRPARRRCCAC